MGLSNLPPGVTDSDIEAQVGTEDGVLSKDCEAFLSDMDLYSQHTRLSAELADIRDSDGHLHFTVTVAISLYDLRAFYCYTRREYLRGLGDGREAMKASLRELISAAAA